MSMAILVSAKLYDTYGILVDIVGAPPFWVEPIIVSSEDDSVQVPINYSITAVNEALPATQPSIALAQELSESVLQYDRHLIHGLRRRRERFIDDLQCARNGSENARARRLAPGEYSAHVDGTDLKPGAYFYVLRAGNVTAARAMLLMK